MSRKFTTWDEFEKELNISPEEEEAIRLEIEVIKATIEARKSKNLTQRQLSEISGVKQPVIARIERCVNSPQVETLIKLLVPMGYTLRVVPLEKVTTTDS